MIRIWNAVVTAAILALWLADDASGQQASQDPQIEIRHARETPAPGFVYVKVAFPDFTLGPLPPGFYVEERALLGTRDFAKMSVGQRTATDLALLLELTREAAVRVAEETKRIAGEYLATFVGSHLISAARLIEPFDPEPLPIFMTLRLPPELADETAARIARRWPP